LTTGRGFEELMIYETGFEQDGKKYYLAGEKKMTSGSIANLWKETTTLFVKFHAGKDRSGPILAAGTLTLSPLELIKMLFSMHASSIDYFKHD
jgi:hypothetical protein